MSIDPEFFSVSFPPFRQVNVAVVGLSEHLLPWTPASASPQRASSAAQGRSSRGASWLPALHPTTGMAARADGQHLGELQLGSGC